MNCIIVDDEPLAREAIELLIEGTPQLKQVGTFSNALAASRFMEANPVDMVFLDIPNHSPKDFSHFHDGLHGIRTG